MAGATEARGCPGLSAEAVTADRVNTEVEHGRLCAAATTQSRSCAGEGTASRPPWWARALRPPAVIRWL